MMATRFGVKAARCAVALTALLAGLGAADPLDTVQKSALELSRLQSQKVQLEADWAWQRELLQSSLAAMQDRVREMEAQRDELAKRTAAQIESRRGIDVANTTAQAAMDEVAKRIEIVGARLREIRPWLPPRLSDALELPYRTLADETLAPGDRLQHAMAVLSRCAQFNHAITYSEEVVRAADGSSRLMKVLYWGLSHAYALDPSGGQAYMGYPGTQGWQWEILPDAAPKVQRLIATFQDQADPQMVELPARIRNLHAVRP